MNAIAISTADLPSLDLDAMLDAVRDEAYVLIKSANLDDPTPGRDLDVLCRDASAFVGKLTSACRAFLDQGIDVEVRTCDERRHIQVDLFFGPTLLLRWDVMQRVPTYPRIRLKPAYFEAVIRNRRTIWRTHAGRHYPIHITGELDDLLLRYIEFAEYFSGRPDKIKHIDHILRALDSNSRLTSFLDRLHRYTDLPKPQTLTGGKSIGGWRHAMRVHAAHITDQLRRGTGRIRELSIRTLRDPLGMTAKLLRKIARRNRPRPQITGDQPAAKPATPRKAA